MSAADSVATALVMAPLVWAVWQWPVQTLIACVGLAVAAVVWTAVGPWAGWCGLGVTVACVAAWSLAGGDERVARPALRSLRRSWTARVWLVLVVAVLVVSTSTDARLSATGLLVAVAAGGWLVWGLSRPEVQARRPARHPVPRSERSGRRVSGPCPVCDGRLVALVRSSGSSVPAGVVGRARCEACGARFVAVADVESPGGVVWLEMPHPDSDRKEGIA